MMTKKDALKISVTSDSFSFNPELRSSLQAIFPLAKFKSEKKKLSKDELISFLKDSDGAIIGLEKMTSDIIDALPTLKIISKYGVGTDNLDLEYMKKKNVALGWSPGLNKNSVSELAIGQMISLSRNLFSSGYKLKQGTWEKDGGRELSELTIGILGTGHIGQEVIKKLSVFGCKIIAHDILDMRDFYQKYGVKSASFETLFKEADLVSIHIPLEPSTQKSINKNVLSLMKPTAMILNTSRGGIVDETDLCEALKKGALKAACMDVFEEEPCLESELLRLPNFIPTPHIAGNSLAAVSAMGQSAIAHLDNFFSKF